MSTDSGMTQYIVKCFRFLRLEVWIALTLLLFFSYGCSGGMVPIDPPLDIPEPKNEPDTSIMTEMGIMPEPDMAWMDKAVFTTCSECSELIEGAHYWQQMGMDLRKRLQLKENQTEGAKQVIYKSIRSNERNFKKTLERLGECEKNHCAKPRKQSQVWSKEPRAPTTVQGPTRTREVTSAKMQTEAPSQLGFAIEISAGHVEMDMPESGFGTIKEGTAERFAGRSSGLLTGYRFGGSLLLPMGNGVGGLDSEASSGMQMDMGLQPSLRVRFNYMDLEDDSDTRIEPGIETAVTLQEPVDGVTGILTGPFGMDIATESTFQRYDLELFYTQPFYRVPTVLGELTLFGGAGVGHSRTDYDVGAWATIPGVSGFLSDWDQEVEEQRTYAIFGAGASLVPTDRLAVGLDLFWKPGWVDAELDSEQHLLAPGATPAVIEDVRQDFSDSFSGYDCRYGANFRLHYSFTDRLWGSAAGGYERTDSFAYPGNIASPDDGEPGIETEDATVWKGELKMGLTF